MELGFGEKLEGPSVEGHFRKSELTQSAFDIITRADLTHSQQIDKILYEGCRLFGVGHGLVSRIEGDRYYVDYAYTVDGSIEGGQVFDLRNTFSELVIQTDRVMSTPDIADAQWRSHPCLSSELTYYLGVRLELKGKPSGTISFFDSKASHPVLEVETDFIKAIGQWIGTAITRARLIEDLNLQATHDMLTGLINRQSFLKRVQSCLDRQDRSPEYNFSLLFIDLDRFKQVNDTLGHHAGDTVLRAIARRLETLVRPRDSLGRFAGDEFVVLLEDVTQEMAMNVASRIMEKLPFPVETRRGRAHFGASVGMAMGRPTVSAAELVNEADAAMYQIKSIRNQMQL